MSEDHADKRVVIFGGSGFIGINLARHLCTLGYKVVIVSRSEPAKGDWSFLRWDGQTLGDWASAVNGAHAVVNLAGRTVDCVKTPLSLDQILRSRVNTTRVVGEAVRAAASPPRVWVQMSTAHIHGDSEQEVDESSHHGLGWAPTIGGLWEQAFDQACPEGVRRVIIRTSFVLGREGAAMKKLGMVTRLGLGGTISNGNQGMSWIHIRDMDLIQQGAIEDKSMSGVYIASAPNPVSNKVFMKSLRKAIGMPIGLPAAAWMIRFGAKYLLKTDPELAIYGRYCIPRRLIDEGFEFAYPELDGALEDLCSK